MTGPGGRWGGHWGGRVVLCSGRCPLTPRSSLPAAWMKEKAAPEDVKYSGEFCTGSAPLTSLLPQAGLGYLRGCSLFSCNYLVCWSSCCRSICVVALPLPRAAPGLPVRCSQRETAARPSPAPSRTPHAPVGLRKGRTELFSLLHSARADAQRPAGIRAGFPRPGLVRVPGRCRAGRSLPPRLTLPFPGRR